MYFIYKFEGDDYLKKGELEKVFELYYSVRNCCFII